MTADDRRADMLALHAEFIERINELQQMVEAAVDNTEVLAKRERFALLFDVRKRLEAITGTDSTAVVIRGALSNLQEPLLEEFAESGKTFRSEFGVTVYVESMIWASAKPDSLDEACAALQTNGFAEFVHPTFHTGTLSAEARRMDRDGEAFPDAVLEHLNVAPKVTVRARRS